MSELIEKRINRNDFRWRLLTTVSAFALLSVVYGVDSARAADDDADHPTVWIEVGGQLERVDGSEERFVPPFIIATPRPSVETISPLSTEQSPRYSIGGVGKITFEPHGTDWVFSASLRYGRSNGNRHTHQQSYPSSGKLIIGSSTLALVPPLAAKFVDSRARYDESHAVIDFQAGKDVGLGMFGSGASSVFSLGVRYAQFNSNSSITLKSNPDWSFNSVYKYFLHHSEPQAYQAFHSFAGSLVAQRSFHGVGPSLSWSASVPVVGHSQDAQIAFDWGLNAALLFGRQKASIQHKTTSIYHPAHHTSLGATRVPLYQHAASPSRAHTVIVPNAGGFAGLSFRYSNAKLSFGYRGDFFLGAMDDRIDVAKKENRGFYGPFATISIGLGG